MTRIETTSSWRLEARQRIAAILAALPKDADMRDKLKALECPRPFSAVSHGRKMWGIERNLALNHLGPKKVMPPAIDTPAVHVTPGEVTCDWCEKKSGCLMCMHVRKRWSDRHSTDWGQWLRWLDVIKADPHDHVVRLAFGDWLSEAGWDSQADIVRKEAEAFMSLEK